MRRFLSNDAVFRNVNLDDPLFRQREVYVHFEGVNAEDFDDHVNFVSVQMRKQHESGDETVEESHVDRAFFSDNANQFKLIYGYKGDDDRRRWLDYEYRTRWAFQDGSSIELPWTKENFSSFPVVPPYQKQTVSVELFDSDALLAQGVRGVTVQLYYAFAGEAKSTRATLRPGSGARAAELEFHLCRADSTSTNTRSSGCSRGTRPEARGRHESSSSVLFVDEMPGA